jgi:hypothetical protein
MRWEGDGDYPLTDTGILRVKENQVEALPDPPYRPWARRRS